LRGLIDIGSICEFDCPHCHQRASADCVRYRMRPREILDCCEEGEALDIRSFLLRSGPDRFYTDKMLSGLIAKIREQFPGCAITLAVGERCRESLRRLADAGADRYVLLQETADRERFRRTHPAALDHDKRLHCLNELKEEGFQTTCGFLVGDQTPLELAKELKFLEEFQPQGVELVPMGAEPERIEYLISLIRLLLPEALICAPENRPGEILAGANVVTMSLIRSRRSFPCCGGCRSDGPADPELLAALRRSLSDVGFQVTTDPAPWNG
jgi:biotin synthase